MFSISTPLKGPQKKEKTYGRAELRNKGNIALKTQQKNGAQSKQNWERGRGGKPGGLTPPRTPRIESLRSVS